MRITTQILSYILDVRAWGIGRPLLITVPTAYLTWHMFQGRPTWISVLVLVALWLASLQEWIDWKKDHSA